MAKMINIKLTDPSTTLWVPRRAWGPKGKAKITGPEVFAVADCSFWHRRAREGSVEILKGQAKAEAAKPEAATTTSDSKTKGEPKPAKN